MLSHILSTFKKLTFVLLLLLCSIQANASHVVGADIYYTYVSGLTYKITVVLYGDCGPASAAVFSTLPSGRPVVCVLAGSTSVTTLNLNIENPSAGVEITPVCAADSAHTQCTNTSYSIPGIKRFVYSINYTLPYTAPNWKFLFKGAYGSASAGRAAAITNITGSSTIEIAATLNNIGRVNSSPRLTIVPVPFFCLNNPDSYNPGAVDADGDSLNYTLVTGRDGATGGTCTVGPAVGYTTGVLAWTPSTFISATTPLRVTAGTFNFDNRTGQISFFPNFPQRALVVYDIQEYRGDSLVGTCQREMTFLVFTCTTPNPTGGYTSTTGLGTIDDSTTYHICANRDSFSVTISGRPADTSLRLTIRTTGTPPGSTFVLTNDSTNHPTGTLYWTSSAITPGTYTFYVTFTDNNCPLPGRSTQAFTVSVFPIPTLAATTIRPSSCQGPAIVNINPNGDGSPWRIDLFDSATGAIIRSRTGITAAYNDTITPGRDSLVIYSSSSLLCNSRYAINITRPTFPTPTATITHPTFCGQNDGTITLAGLNPFEIDTIHYNINGVPQTPVVALIPASGTYVFSNLCAGRYDNFYITYGICRSRNLGPFVLNNPSFPVDRLEFVNNPTQCGYCDGTIKIHGLHPYQTDSVYFTVDGSPHAPIVAYVYGDSTITLGGLCAGRYDNIIVRTVGACPVNPNSCISRRLGPMTLVAPTISSSFDTLVKLGCRTDTVILTNTSSPSTGLNYRWYFGDGFTDTLRNPRHIYNPWGAASYTIKLYITNARCVDSTIKTVSFTDIAHAAFTYGGKDTLCQADTAKFTNASTGIGLSYLWDFGDGTTSNLLSPKHIYNNKGIYTVKLHVTDYIPCSDNYNATIVVDSNSVVSLAATDTVFCKGGASTFTGTYTNIGNTGVIWDFGDGMSKVNVNPVQHAYDMTGNLTVQMTAKYRVCPDKTIQKYLRIYDYPTIYLGKDTSLCPGSAPLAVGDNINAGNPAASWVWNTGEFTPSIVITKPGNYVAKVSIHGCVSVDSIMVANDCYISFPNIFTPNGDGVNDKFFPRQILSKGVVSFNMTVYNRWGQLMYTAKPGDMEGWDGTFNGEMQQQGVYIYMIDATFKDGQVWNKRGNVTLIR